MQDIDELLTELSARVQRTGIAVQAISRLAGLGVNTLKHLKKPGWAPTPTTIRALQEVVMHLESLSQESLVKLTKEKNIHPPKIVGKEKNVGNSNKKQTMTKTPRKSSKPETD